MNILSILRLCLLFLLNDSSRYPIDLGRFQTTHHLLFFRTKMILLLLIELLLVFQELVNRPCMLSLWRALRSIQSGLESAFVQLLLLLHFQLFPRFLISWFLEFPLSFMEGVQVSEAIWRLGLGKSLGWTSLTWWVLVQWRSFLPTWLTFVLTFELCFVPRSLLWARFLFHMIVERIWNGYSI